MGMPDLDFWAKEWPVIRDAPHLVLGGIIIMIAITGSIIWLIINWGYRQRLKLAYEREAFADKVRNDIARQFNDFKGAAAAGVGIDALIARVANAALVGVPPFRTAVLGILARPHLNSPNH